MIEYDSKTVSTKRKLNGFTPPGYSPEKTYPVLYLLHGIGGNETEWQRFANPGNLLASLIVDGKVKYKPGAHRQRSRRSPCPR
jgi:enterochelin esterase-like enzyme